MPADAIEPSTNYFPPNWDNRPRVKQWNGHILREDWLTRDKADLVGIIELLNHQVTTANQNALDASFLAEWCMYRLLVQAASVRESTCTSLAPAAADVKQNGSTPSSRSAQPHKSPENMQ